MIFVLGGLGASLSLLNAELARFKCGHNSVYGVGRVSNRLPPLYRTCPTSASAGQGIDMWRPLSAVTQVAAGSSDVFRRTPGQSVSCDGKPSLRFSNSLPFCEAEVSSPMMLFSETTILFPDDVRVMAPIS